jgi:hypothetical protein
MKERDFDILISTFVISQYPYARRSAKGVH